MTRPQTARQGWRARVVGQATRLATHPVARRTGWMLLGYGARLVLQTASFIVLARALRPSGFGAFAAALALATVLGALFELGAYSLVVRDVTRGVSTARAVGNSVLLAVLVIPAALALLALLKVVLLPSVGWAVVLPIGLANFAGDRCCAIARAVHVAEGVLKRSAALEVLRSGLQLVAVSLLASVGGTVTTWAWLYLAVCLLSGAVALAAVAATWGRLSWSWVEARARIRPGLHFAVGAAAQNAYTDIDKALLARLASLPAAGVYSAAHRVVAVAYLPVSAFLGTLYPRFFSHGAKGVRQARAFAWRIAPITGSVGLLTSVALWMAAPVLARLLGSGYADSAEALRLLAPLVAIQSLLFPFANALSGSGNQAARTAANLGALGLNALLDVWLIPSHGLRGAAFAAVATQAGLTVAMIALSAGRAGGEPTQDDAPVSRRAAQVDAAAV